MIVSTGDPQILFSASWAQRRDGKSDTSYLVNPDALILIEQSATAAAAAAGRPSLATLMPDPRCHLTPAQTEKELEKEAEALVLRKP